MDELKNARIKARSRHSVAQIAPSLETYTEILERTAGKLSERDLARCSINGRAGGLKAAMQGPKHRADKNLRKF